MGFVGVCSPGPALFDQGNEERAGFFKGAKAEGAAGGGVSAAADSGVGGDDQHVSGEGGLAGGCGAGLNDAKDGDGDGVLNGVQSEGAGGVAGDDQELCALLADQELGALGGVAGDGAAGLGAVGEAGRVSKESELSLREAMEEGAEDGESAEAGIEYADGVGHGS